MDCDIIYRITEEEARLRQESQQQAVLESLLIQDCRASIEAVLSQYEEWPSVGMTSLLALTLKEHKKNHNDLEGLISLLRFISDAQDKQ